MTTFETHVKNMQVPPFQQDNSEYFCRLSDICALFMDIRDMAVADGPQPITFVLLHFPETSNYPAESFQEVQKAA